MPRLRNELTALVPRRRIPKANLPSHGPHGRSPPEEDAMKEKELYSTA
jgi:hypothetical protein